MRGGARMKASGALKLSMRMERVSTARTMVRKGWRDWCAASVPACAVWIVRQCVRAYKDAEYRLICKEVGKELGKRFRSVWLDELRSLAIWCVGGFIIAAPLAAFLYVTVPGPDGVTAPKSDFLPKMCDLMLALLVDTIRLLKPSVAKVRTATGVFTVAGLWTHFIISMRPHMNRIAGNVVQTLFPILTFVVSLALSDAGDPVAEELMPAR